MDIKLINMVDQTQDDISEVILKNSIKRFENVNKRLFEDWLKKCPVNFDIIPETSDESIKTINFHFKERRGI